MEAKDTKLYSTASNYFKGPDGMRNEVAMWFVASGLLTQEISRKIGNEPYGGLGGKRGEDEREKIAKIEVLDLCSGSGSFPNHLSLALPWLNVTCVDLNEDFVKTGQELFPSWEFVIGDVVKARLGKKFEVITASSAYHHISDEEKVDFLKNIKDHLAEDGLVIICENFLPDYNSPKERELSVVKYFSELRAYYQQGNATEDSQEAIEEVFELEKAGVEEHKVSFRIFEDHLREAGLKIENRVAVWQPSDFAQDKAGSYVITIRKVSL
jgi:ubiquinone/menaquinone biosynthesis C-methylase UbiE